MKGFNQVNAPIELPDSTYKRLRKIAKRENVPVQRLLSRFAHEIATEVFHGDLTPPEQEAGKKIIRDMKTIGLKMDVSGCLSRLLCEFIDSYECQSAA